MGVQDITKVLQPWEGKEKVQRSINGIPSGMFKNCSQQCENKNSKVSLQKILCINNLKSLLLEIL